MARLHASGFGDAGSAGQRTTGGRAQRVALALLRVCLGVFMFFFGFERASWLLDATPLSTQLASWLVDAAPVSRWYLERLIPGAPVFGATRAAGSDDRRSRAHARLLDENRRGDLARRGVEPSAGRRLDDAVYLFDGCERAAAGWWFTGAGYRWGDREKGKTKNRKTNNDLAAFFAFRLSFSFQCTCLSQSFFPPEYTPNFFRARSIFQRRYR